MAISVPTAPLAQERSRLQRQSEPAPSEPRGEPLIALDIAVEGILGADLRMIYGLGIPVFFIVALMIPMSLAPSYWLDAGVLAVTVCVMGFIVTKFLKMLDEEPEDAAVQPADHLVI